MNDPRVKDSIDIAKRIFKSYDNSSQGNLSFANNIDEWRCEINCDWTKNTLVLNISLIKPRPSDDFVECELYEAAFVSTITRSKNYSFKGKPSEYSEMLYSSDYAKKLMDQRNPRISLISNGLNYSCKIKNCTQSHMAALINFTSLLMSELSEV